MPTREARVGLLLVAIVGILQCTHACFVYACVAQGQAG